jgi:hypothetical protein
MAKSRRGGIRKPTRASERRKARAAAPAPVELPDFPKIDDDDESHTQVTSVGDLELWLDNQHRFRAVDDEDDEEKTNVMGQTLIGALVSGETRRTLDTHATVSGSLGEFAVIELLQMFAQRGRAGVLVVGDDSGVGRVWVEHGTLVSASWKGAPDLEPMAVLRRLARIQTGEFWFGPPRNEPSGDLLNQPLANVLLHIFGDDDDDDPDVSEGALSDYALLRVSDPLEPLLSDLPPEELNVLQLAMNHRTLGAVLAQVRGREEAVRATLRALIARDYLYVADDDY